MLKFLKIFRNNNHKTLQILQKYLTVRLQTQSIQLTPLPFQACPTPYQNHPLLPFIFLAMIMNQTILPVPSLRKTPTKTKANSFLSALFTKKMNKGLNKGSHYCHCPRPPTHLTNTPYTSNLPNAGIFYYSTHGH
jgi:hypothetical protein